MTPTYIKVLEDPNQQKALVFINTQSRPAKQAVEKGLVETSDQFYSKTPLDQMTLYNQANMK